MKFIAPISEQIVTTTMHFLKVPGELSFIAQTSLVMKTFDTCLLTPQENALLGSQLVLAWVLRRSNFGPSADRLLMTTQCHIIFQTIPDNFWTLLSCLVSDNSI